MSKPTGVVEHLDKEIEDVSQLIQDATLPFKGDKVKSQVRSKGKWGMDAKKKVEIAADSQANF